ncbi:MAG: TnsA endonuclease N-terminal domain-containing protein [Bacillota bacterium]
MSQLELKYFYTLEWSPAVTDIREQYPLPLDQTLEIAGRLQIKHPTDPKTKEAAVMTTDFVIDVCTAGGTELRARTVKMAKDLNSRRALEKLEIERTWWQEQGMDWGIVTENEIPEPLAANVRWVHKARDLSSAPDISPHILGQIEHGLSKQMERRRNPLAHAALAVDEQLGLEPGSSLWVVRHLIANRYWLVDMNTVIDTGKPLAVTRSYMKINQAGDSA